MSGKKHNKLKGLWATSLTWVIYIDLKNQNFCIPFRDVRIFLSKTLNSRNNLFKNQLYMLICACLKSNMIIIKCSVVILEKNIFKYFSLYMYMSICVQLSFPLWDPLSVWVGHWCGQFFNFASLFDYVDSLFSGGA